jgi:hypothetical protein
MENTTINQFMPLSKVWLSRNMENTTINQFMPLSKVWLPRKIFTRFTLTGQSLVKKLRTEFHENPTDVLVANVRSQTDRRIDVRGIHKRRSSPPPSFFI